MLFRVIKDEDFSNIIAPIQRLTTYDGSEYSLLYLKVPALEGSEYSLLYLKGWDFFNYQSMQIAEEDGVVYLRFTPDGKYRDEGEEGYIYLPPLCVIDKVKDAYAKIVEQCESDGDSFHVISTPESYVNILGNEYEYAFNQDFAEYLYDPQSLMTYAGKKLHSKRNHVNNFVKAYRPNEEGGAAFRPYAAADRDKVLAFIKGWEESKEFDDKELDEMADAELGVIRLALSLVNRQDNYFADVIEYEGKIIGFSLGEVTPSNLGITHIEKGDITYDGVYAYLCQAFAQKHYKAVRVVNRQEDMGLEGLRKSKQSYHPIGFCHKYVVKKLGK